MPNELQGLLMPKKKGNALQELAQGVSKGFWADGLGGPVDLITTLANLGIAGAGYAGHKSGLLSQPIPLIEKPVGGSDWIAEKMRSAGILGDNPGSTADNYGRVLGGLLSPVVQAKAPQIASAANAAPAAAKAGAYALGERGAQMAENHLQRIGAQPAIFAGIGAKTADKAALARAEKLAASGADPKAIWRDTGWFKGGDGKWRFEIDDSGAMFNPSGAGATKQENAIMHGHGYDLGPAVGGLIEHPALRDAYGGVTKNTRVGNKNTLFGDGVQGAYDDATGTLTINAPVKPEDGRSTVLHELQHAVQQSEGFSKGGSPEQMRDEALRLLRRDVASGEIESTERAMSMLPMYQSNAYQRLAGEAEARAVQSRMKLTQAQRRALFPLDSYDVPVNSLIYR